MKISINIRRNTKKKAFDINIKGGEKETGLQDALAIAITKYIAKHS